MRCFGMSGPTMLPRGRLGLHGARMRASRACAAHPSMSGAAAAATRGSCASPPPAASPTVPASANGRWSTHSSRRARAVVESASRLDARELGALVGELHLKPTTGGYHCRHAGGCVASLSPSGARLHAATQRRAADADTRERRRAAGATLQWYVPHHGAESAAGVTSRRTEIRPRAIARRGKRGLHATGRPSGWGACNHGCCGGASQTSRTRERAEPSRAGGLQ